MAKIAKAVVLISFGVFIDLTQFLLIILGFGFKAIGTVLTLGFGAPFAIAGGFVIILFSSFLSLIILPVDIICNNTRKKKLSLTRKLLRFAPYLIEFLPYFNIFPAWTIKYIIQSQLKDEKNK